jgi:hypothetical protein
MITASHARILATSNQDKLQIALSALEPLISTAAGEGRTSLVLQATDWEDRQQVVSVLVALGYTAEVKNVVGSAWTLTLDWSAA